MTTATYHNTTNQPAPVAEINTTPLVDVMLVLLIIFMITAPQLQNLSAVKIPIGGDGSLPKPTMILLAIESVDNALRMHLDGVSIRSNELAANAKQHGSLEKPPTYNLRIDPNVSYSDVPLIIATLKRNGIKDIRFDELSNTSNARTSNK
jgi:biopolymer transport protein ExbD